MGFLPITTQSVVRRSSLGYKSPFEYDRARETLNPTTAVRGGSDIGFKIHISGLEWKTRRSRMHPPLGGGLPPVDAVSTASAHGETCHPKRRLG